MRGGWIGMRFGLGVLGSWREGGVGVLIPGFLFNMEFCFLPLFIGLLRLVSV